MSFKKECPLCREEFNAEVYGPPLCPKCLKEEKKMTCCKCGKLYDDSTVPDALNLCPSCRKAEDKISDDYVRKIFEEVDEKFPMVCLRCGKKFPLGMNNYKVTKLCPECREPKPSRAGPVLQDSNLRVIPQVGWQCPCCRKVHAPWVQFCDCQVALVYPISNGNGTATYDWDPKVNHEFTPTYGPKPIQ